MIALTNRLLVLAAAFLWITFFEAVESNIFSAALRSSVADSLLFSAIAFFTALIAVLA
ncbi:uncharacterized protein METZ01_LOCUS153534 [marine metagenome]|uniref:Uncharacterized protein n=1 Tax=marine metagenome TaxID=408172 RepID=A0A382AGI8_9ZZZZ